MYPNPQEVLPLPPGSHVAEYTAHVNALVDACRSSAPDRLRQWVTGWVDGVRRAAGASTDRAQVELYANLVEAFARRMLSSPGTCVPAVAQLVLARVHGFSSWEELSEHLIAINDPRSRVVAFERAADVIVAGDVTTLHELLGKYPGLV